MSARAGGALGLAAHESELSELRGCQPALQKNKNKKNKKMITPSSVRVFDGLKFFLSGGSGEGARVCFSPFFSFFFFLI